MNMPAHACTIHQIHLAPRATVIPIAGDLKRNPTTRTVSM